MSLSSPADPGRGSRLAEAAASWAAVRWIEVDGRLIRYREAGAGDPVVLVHGLGVSADYWFRNAAPIAAAGFRVLAPDLPGFGRTDGPRGGLSIAAQADALRQWSRTLDLSPAAYLGHSLSCQTVLELAAADPQQVRSVILAAPTGKATPRLRLVRQAIGLVRDLRREPLTLSALVAQAYFRAGARRVLQTWSLGATHDPLQLLPLPTPGLVIVGDDDPVVDLKFASRLADGLARGRLVTLRGGAHAVIFQPAKAFNQSVIAFLLEVQQAP